MYIQYLFQTITYIDLNLIKTMKMNKILNSLYLNSNISVIHFFSKYVQHYLGLFVTINFNNKVENCKKIIENIIIFNFFLHVAKEKKHYLNLLFWFSNLFSNI